MREVSSSNIETLFSFALIRRFSLSRSHLPRWVYVGSLFQDYYGINKTDSIGTIYVRVQVTGG